MIKSYEINKETIAIIPIDKKTSKVFEFNNSFFVKDSVMNIIDNSCRYFGSSYHGRFEGTKSMLNISYKNPIIIEESREIIFFPTASPRADDCNWISLENIEKYEKDDFNTLVLFKNGQSLSFNISYLSFENQIYRASRLLLVLKNKKIEINRP
ncbi:MAG TPA: competence protein [Tenericutes bacterium]|nr:competence protein [Mycoplasmatota bacterium]